MTDASGSLHGFPPALTSFVGRAAAVAAVANDLTQCRLVTVTGPGGAGKTRLAGEVAHQVAARFADGAWLAELAAVRDPAQVATAVAAALGIRDLPPADPATALTSALSRRQLLLVLDNCEHVIAAAADLCAKLLLAADDVRILTTSREPLPIAGEARYRLPPLTLPTSDATANPDGSEAVALFADRACRADATFTLNEETAPAVAHLVARLDGLPLAIELAAARVEALGVAQLLDRIADRFTLLETLRAYAADKLSKADEGEGEPDTAAAALAAYALRLAEDAMAGLTADTSEEATARWLDAEDPTTRQALDWAIEHDTELAPRLATALAWWWQVRGRLAAQVPRLRQAVDRTTPGSDAWSRAHTWLGQASLDSADPAGALNHFTAVLDAIGDRGPFPLLARCLSGRAATLLSMGRIAEAADDTRRSLALTREGDYPVAEAIALGVLGLLACVTGDLDGAVQLARQGEQKMDGRAGPTARVCGQILTTVLIAADDLAAAERVCAVALASARDAGDLWSLGNLLEKMVVLDLNAGRLEAAAAHLREGLQTALRTGVRARLLDDLDCCGYLLGPAQAQAAEERGQAMSMATAAEYALMLTSPEPVASATPPGTDRLSPRERELVTLVAQGRTDAQIAEQLFISVRTVSSHLDRIRDKTGCRRADLTRLALSTGLV